MKSSSAGILVSAFLSLIISTTRAQTNKAFNQNSARSGNGLSLSFAPVYSTASNSSSDSLLFRGSGTGFRFGADYFFGKAGIGFLSGFCSSSADDATINTFLKTFPFSPDELIINKTKQQNMYLLLGPSVRFGKTVELFAHAKGGLFINNSGLVSLQQKGAQRPLYRNEATSKSIYPGFLTGLGIQYKTRSEAWSFGIGADYLSTKSEVNNYDIRRGAEPLKLSRTISDIVTGITIRYNILSPRDQNSGQASGKRTRETGSGMASGRRGSGLATGRRTYQPGQPVYGNITSEESNNASCGPVTQRTINPDGTTEEMTFSCPDDAASYNSRMKIDGGMPNRISMNVTVPKQTQGATFGEKVNQGLHAAGAARTQNGTAPKQTQGSTFGEKVNQGLHAAGSALSQGAGKNIISGKLSWTSPASTGIVTNKTMAGGGASGAAAASYAATGMIINNNNSGMATGFYARDHSSGQASGKRSREKGSGLATGRRQYEPVFADNEGGTCETCIATAKLSSVQNNPYFVGNDLSGENVSQNGNSAATGNAVEGITVSLLEPQSGALIAKTKTGSSGDFFFANVPDGDYILAVSGSFLSKKGYDYYAAKSTDLLGQVTVSDASLQLLINSSNEQEPMTQKAGISTSRSNIRRSVTIIEADTDGDGVVESTKVLASMNDGTMRDVTADARISTAGTVKKVTVRAWNPEKKQGMAGAPGGVKEYTISIDADHKTTMTSQYENGTKEETAAVTKIIQHTGVTQYDINTGDQDEDGVAALIKTKTKSNQSNDRVAADGEEEIWSPRSNISELRLIPVGLDENGITQMSAAPPGIPAGPALRPGNPIGGLTIKGGRNPGGNQRTTQTNENGEFEFTGLEPGDYTFTVEQQVVIESQLWISAGKARDHNSSRSNKTGSVIAPDPNNSNTKGQDHNSTRSNKTANMAAPDPGNSGGNKVQDHNSSRSNKSSSLATPGPDGDGERKGVTKLTASQNSQSLRSILVEADLDGDGDYETDITSGTKDEIVLNENGEIITAPQQKAGVSTSRSNIRNRSSLQDKGDAIYIGYGTALWKGTEVAVKVLYSAKQGKTGSAK